MAWHQMSEYVDKATGRDGEYDHKRYEARPYKDDNTFDSESFHISHTKLSASCCKHSFQMKLIMLRHSYSLITYFYTYIKIDDCLHMNIYQTS